MLARVIAQYVAEIRAVTEWLLNEGCPSVGISGISFGGWIAGMTACCDARIGCAVMAVPAVRRTRYSPPIFWRGVFEALRPAQEALDTTRLNLSLSRPVIPKENILLIEGIYDLFAEREPIEELWEKWGRPEIWRLPHGHVSGLLVPGLAGRVIEWIGRKMMND